MSFWPICWGLCLLWSPRLPLSIPLICRKRSLFQTMLCTAMLGLNHGSWWRWWPGGHDYLCLFLAGLPSGAKAAVPSSLWNERRLKHPKPIVATVSKMVFQVDAFECFWFESRERPEALRMMLSSRMHFQQIPRWNDPPLSPSSNQHQPPRVLGARNSTATQAEVPRPGSRLRKPGKQRWSRAWLCIVCL